MKRVRTIREGLFNFLYVEKMEQFINVYYDHQVSIYCYLILMLSRIFCSFMMYYIAFYHIVYQNVFLFKYLYNI